MKNSRCRLLISFLPLVLIAVLLCACFDAKTKPVIYEFTVIRRGTLERTASATGTINPVASIKVLSRMNRPITQERTQTPALQDSWREPNPQGRPLSTPERETAPLWLCVIYGT
jgi:hypothetical protein